MRVEHYACCIIQGSGPKINEHRAFVNSSTRGKTTIHLHTHALKKLCPYTHTRAPIPTYANTPTHSAPTPAHTQTHRHTKRLHIKLIAYTYTQTHIYTPTHKQTPAKYPWGIACLSNAWCVLTLSGGRVLFSVWDVASLIVTWDMSVGYQLRAQRPIQSQGCYPVHSMFISKSSISYSRNTWLFKCCGNENIYALLKNSYILIIQISKLYAL